LGHDVSERSNTRRDAQDDHDEQRQYGQRQDIVRASASKITVASAMPLIVQKW